jgi:hypothetical protein
MSLAFIRLITWAAETLFGSMGMFFYFLSVFQLRNAYAPAVLMIIIAMAFHCALNPKQKIR